MKRDRDMMDVEEGEAFEPAARPSKCGRWAAEPPAGAAAVAAAAEAEPAAAQPQQPPLPPETRPASPRAPPSASPSAAMMTSDDGNDDEHGGSAGDDGAAAAGGNDDGRHRHRRRSTAATVAAAAAAAVAAAAAAAAASAAGTPPPPPPPTRLLDLPCAALEHVVGRVPRRFRGALRGACRALRDLMDPMVTSVDFTYVEDDAARRAALNDAHQAARHVESMRRHHHHVVDFDEVPVPAGEARPSPPAEVRRAATCAAVARCRARFPALRCAVVDVLANAPTAALAPHLQNLTRLDFLARGSSISRRNFHQEVGGHNAALDPVRLPGGADAVMPALRALSLSAVGDRTSDGLAQVLQFAPNVEELFIGCLTLTRGRRVAHRSVTHFGCHQVEAFLDFSNPALAQPVAPPGAPDADVDADALAAQLAGAAAGGGFFAGWWAHPGINHAQGLAYKQLARWLLVSCFPRLEVVTRLPPRLLAPDNMYITNPDVSLLLRVPWTVTALRHSSLYALKLQQPEVLANLQRLALHMTTEPEVVADPASGALLSRSLLRVATRVEQELLPHLNRDVLAKAPNLRHVELTYLGRDGGVNDTRLLRALLALEHLETLVLPRQLLCDRGSCCSTRGEVGARRKALRALAAHPAMRRLTFVQLLYDDRAWNRGAHRRPGTTTAMLVAGGLLANERSGSSDDAARRAEHDKFIRGRLERLVESARDKRRLLGRAPVAIALLPGERLPPRAWHDFGRRRCKGDDSRSAVWGEYGGGVVIASSEHGGGDL